MKTLTDLFQLVAQATEQNGEELRTWFFSYSGHVNKMSIDYYFTGWIKNGKSTGLSEEIEQTLTPEGIQALYWFIKTRLK